MRIPVLIIASLLIPAICVAQVNPRNQLPVNPALRIKTDTTPVRFAFTIRDVVSNNSPGAIPLNKWYNHNESVVAVSANSITINRSGLYHFDCFLQAAALSDRSPTATIYLSGVQPSSSLIFVKDDALPASPSTGVYRRNWNFSVDIFIKAPATLQLMRYVVGSSGSTSIEGSFLGRLISD